MPRDSGRTPAAVVACVTVALVMTIASPEPSAHKAITSKYTYNEHVFPIVRDRCGRCHFEDGPTPMSLMTFRDAQPWAESIREQLVSQAMPPWYADPLAPAVKGGHAINAKELDTLLTWAVGGAPEGDPVNAPPVVNRPAEWRAGTPDAVFTMPVPHVVASGVLQDSVDVLIPTGFTTEKWIAAVDLLPGTPSMVRSATIATENGPILAPWVPGDDVVRVPNGAAFRVAPGERLRLRVNYKKHWRDELVERSDRSTVGVYFGDAPVTGRGIDSLSLESNGREVGTGQETLAGPARILAVTPLLERTYPNVSVEAVLPSGKRVILMRLQSPRYGWARRYWLLEPVELPAKSRLEVNASGEGAVRITLDFTPL
jgi:hypothetical protein